MRHHRSPHTRYTWLQLHSRTAHYGYELNTVCSDGDAGGRAATVIKSVKAARVHVQEEVGLRGSEVKGVRMRTSVFLEG